MLQEKKTLLKFGNFFGELQIEHSCEICLSTTDSIFALFIHINLAKFLM